MKETYHVLVVEDDEQIRDGIEIYLKSQGYEVSKAADGIEGLTVLKEKEVHLAIIDVMMPRMDGYEFTKILRECDNYLPILMVSAKQLAVDKNKGFAVGTDDYMKKPIDEEEMILRIAALLRRSQIVSERKLVIGQTTLYYDSLSVSTPQGAIELPQKEFLLLYKLLSYQSKIFTRRQLMDEIWDVDSESDERTVDVHVSRLRERLRGNSDFEIQTVRGLGYKAVPKR